MILPLCSALHPDVESSVQERHGAVAAHLEESCKSDPRDGTLLLCGEAERAGILQPEEEKAQGRLDSGLKEGDRRRKVTDSLAGSAMTGQGEMVLD